MNAITAMTATAPPPFVFHQGTQPLLVSMPHAFKNTGTDLMKFLCIIPHEQPVLKKTLNPFADETANNC